MTWIYWLGWLLFRCLFRTLFGLRIQGEENLVREGPVMVVANHESFVDPPLIGTLYTDDMYYLARKSLMTSALLKWIYISWNSIPIDQDRPDMTGLKAIIKLLQSGKRVVVFPEGQRTEDGNLCEAQPGVGLIASKANTLIQPIRIRGAREALPRGSAKIRFVRLTVTIGPAYRLTEKEIAEARGKEGYQKLADRIMASIAEL
jgi:1-acyl-sn-glycerol-3-phosphate acyltransferase